ncbi:hypothetical protein P168DRAFT_49552 [Aspergillus campestris IBT 28561]|uniref:Secreted protein n=1 Tax=Aspergillus campestris (strain IBT 28561) TaxID=1392248 RepID=A0A2I1CV13_ASPC2|nr:uncharacterized protein P168DRAFT_49552 [Aspergillus campestris IBT 28561]PKY01466.1 hypothetical protein P168DRAFT_49552 [Aspergillus campestris IBT 28561]
MINLLVLNLVLILVESYVASCLVDLFDCFFVHVLICQICHMSWDGLGWIVCIDIEDIRIVHGMNNRAGVIPALHPAVSSSSVICTVSSL